MAVITNVGGPGIMASDAIERVGMRLASLTPETQQKLRASLPAAASAANPIDVLGDAGADRYALAIQMALADPNVGQLLVVLTPQTSTQIPETASALGELAKGQGKPVFAAFMGDVAVEPGVQVLNQHSVPNYQVPEKGCSGHERAVGASPAGEHAGARRGAHRGGPGQPRWLCCNVCGRKAGATIGDAEGVHRMKPTAHPSPKSVVAATPEEAVTAAESIGYPVVMKIASPDILHKTDSPVKLNINSAVYPPTLLTCSLFAASASCPSHHLGLPYSNRWSKVAAKGDHRYHPGFQWPVLASGRHLREALKDVTFREQP